MFDLDDAYSVGAGGMGGFIEYGPGDIEKQLDAVDKFLGVVNRDVSKHTKKEGLPQMQARWDSEVWQPWQTFYRDTKGIVGTPNLLRDSTYRRAEAFRQLGLRFRENLLKKVDTGTEVTPIDVPPAIKKPPGKGAPGTKQGVSLPPRSAGGFPWRWLLIGGGLAVGGYIVYKMWPTRQATHLLAPTEQVNNPPTWAMDTDIWESAKIAVQPYKARYDNPDAVITHVYKQMGGRIG